MLGVRVHIRCGESGFTGDVGAGAGEMWGPGLLSEVGSPGYHPEGLLRGSSCPWAAVW